MKGTSGKGRLQSKGPTLTLSLLVPVILQLKQSLELFQLFHGSLGSLEQKQGKGHFEVRPIAGISVNGWKSIKQNGSLSNWRYMQKCIQCFI